MPKLRQVKPGDRSPMALLRKVRDVLTAPESAQQRLDKLVQAIARQMDSEVCSIYFARAGDILELCASEGLKATSVHLTRLRFGEGLVGEIALLAEPVNLPEAQTHPKYVYRPETGEELFHSFVGVPILHSHRVIGVLVVQSKETRIYSDEQLEILQTVAMVLAELAIAGKIVDLMSISSDKDKTSTSQYHTGLKLSPGLARAPAVLHRPKIEIARLVAEDPEHELQRFHRALIDLQSSMEELLRSSSLHKDDEQREIVETYRMFSHDRGWIERISEAIKTGLTAEAAVRKVQEQMHARMSHVSNAYLRERMQDIEDLSTQLLYHLAGVSPTASRTDLPEQFILVARALSPAELLEYGGGRLKGMVLEEGSASSHIAIMARMMDIPVVARVAHVTELLEKGDVVIVDGDNGEVYLRPSSDVEEAVNEHLEQRRVRDAHYEGMRDLPSVTADGMRVSLNLNIGLYLNAGQLSSPDIDGIGLYRTELPYLASNDFPDVDQQKKIYGEIIRQAKGKRVVFRSFDIGGDKQVPYIQIEDEENPAMGWRATRIGLDRPVILRRQFRALIRAAAGQHLSVMFPFIADLSEFEATRSLFDKEMERAKVEGHVPPKAVRVGTMIEIPSLLFQLPALMKRVDFVSIGSNDLTQFLFACDRNSERLSGRYDPLSPIVLGIVRQIVAECEKAGVEAGFCGEMATRPIEAMALLGCGIRNLSVPPSAIGPVKAMVRSLNCMELSKYMDYLCGLSDHTVRNQLEQFARDHGVVLG